MTRLRHPNAVALALFLTISFLYFGLPIVAHPGRDLIATGVDADIFVWSFAWWPHAILHGLNPFYTHVLWAPQGANLAWTASAPGLAVVFSPLTLLVGPAASFNVATMLMPALSAWTAFLLCRRLVRAFWPSLLGGYLFGFSSYMLGQMEGHLHVTAVFLVPLGALLVLRFLDGELDVRGLGWRLGALLAVQLTFSTEILFTATLALGVGLALAWWLVPGMNQKVRSLVRPLAGAYALAAVVTSPFLYYLVTGLGSRPPGQPQNLPADLLNFVVPTGLSQISDNWGLNGVADHYLGNDAENGAYLGGPLLAIILLYAWRHSRSPRCRLLVASLGLAMFAALGTSLHVAGHRIVALPWALLAHLPLFENTIPVRLSLYVSLAAAVIAALWAAGGERLWLRVLLPALAIVAVFPHFGIVPYLAHGYWNRDPDRQAFFTTGIYRTCLSPNENVMLFPYNDRGDSMLWQAESDFRFRMAGGYITPNDPASWVIYPGFGQIRDGILPYRGMADVDQLAHDKGIGAILVENTTNDPELPLWNGFLSKTIKPIRLGGLSVYPLTGGAAMRARCTGKQ